MPSKASPNVGIPLFCCLRNHQPPFTFVVSYVKSISLSIRLREEDVSKGVGAGVGAGEGVGGTGVGVGTGEGVGESVCTGSSVTGGSVCSVEVVFGVHPHQSSRLANKIKIKSVLRDFIAVDRS